MVKASALSSCSSPFTRGRAIWELWEGRWYLRGGALGFQVVRTSPGHWGSGSQGRESYGTEAPRCLRVTAEVPFRPCTESSPRPSGPCMHPLKAQPVLQGFAWEWRLQMWDGQALLQGHSSSVPVGVGEEGRGMNNSTVLTGASTTQPGLVPSQRGCSLRSAWMYGIQGGSPLGEEAGLERERGLKGDWV